MLFDVSHVKYAHKALNTKKKYNHLHFVLISIAKKTKINAKKLKMSK